MRILIMLILLMGFSLQLSAQEYFYYYKGTKIALELNPEYIFISSPDKNSVDKARINGINIIPNFPNSNITQEDNTGQILMQPPYFKVKRSVKFWKEVQFNQQYSEADYLAQIQTIRATNRDIVVAPYFKTATTDKIGLSHFFYVKLKQQQDLPLLLKEIEKYNLELVGHNKFMSLWYTVSVTPKSPNALKMANLFYETGLFEYAEPDLMLNWSVNDAQGTTEVELTPNDPFYTDQWGLNNTGQGSGIAGIDINAEAAWDITLGDNVRVAVVDHGFEMNHPDLDDNTIGTGYDTETGTSPANVWGPHGIACASIIGAEGNNSEGISGVAPNTGLISISQPFGGTNSTQELADGISWAWDDGEADVISNSWGGGSPSSLIDDAISDALTLGRGGLGSIVVFATGNSNNGVKYPANGNDDVLAVGAMSPCGERKQPGSCDGEGWGSCYGLELDVVAPGVLIPSADRQGDVAGCGDYNPSPCTASAYSNQDYHSRFNGTSSACPHVAGIAALVLSVNPSLTVQEVNDIIEQSAQKVRIDLYTYSTTIGRPNGTWHNEMGYGLVDAYEAVLLAQQCANNLTLNSVTVYPPSIVDNEVSDFITASNYIIQSGADVTFDAGQKIELLPGFDAQLGSNFLGVIDGCNGMYKGETNDPIILAPTTNEAISSIKCYPNPFSSNTTIFYTLSNEQNVSLSILSTTGQEIVNLLDNTAQSAGKHEIQFNGQDLPKGMYFYRFTDGTGTNHTGKMMLVD